MSATTLTTHDMKTVTQLFLDRFAIGLSLLCAMHCLAVPVLLIAFPSYLATFHLDDHVFHELMLWLVIPSSAIAIFLGCQRHKDRLVFGLAGIGIAAMISITLFGHDVLGETGEKLAALIAGAVLAYAHWRNYSLCRSDSCKH